MTFLRENMWSCTWISPSEVAQGAASRRSFAHDDHRSGFIRAALVDVHEAYPRASGFIISMTRLPKACIWFIDVGGNVCRSSFMVLNWKTLPILTFPLADRKILDDERSMWATLHLRRKLTPSNTYMHRNILVVDKKAGTEFTLTSLQMVAISASPRGLGQARTSATVDFRGSWMINVSPWKVYCSCTRITFDER